MRSHQTAGAVAFLCLLTGCFSTHPNVSAVSEGPMSPPSPARAAPPERIVQPIVLHLSGTRVTDIMPTEDASALDLAASLIIPPGVYRFAGRAYTLKDDGLYRLLLPMKENQQRIIYQGDVWALLSALCWLHSHGSRDDKLTVDQLLQDATRQKLITTCGWHSKFCRHVLTLCGVPARSVTSRALDDLNGYDDGHALIEVWHEGRWVLVDVDQHVAFTDGGRRLSLLDMIARAKDGRYTLEPLARSIPLAVTGFVEDGYDYGLFGESALHSEEAQRRWYRRVLRIAHVGSEWTASSDAELERARRVWPGITLIPMKEFEERYYGPGARPK